MFDPRTIQKLNTYRPLEHYSSHQQLSEISTVENRLPRPWELDIHVLFFLLQESIIVIFCLTVVVLF